MRGIVYAITASFLLGACATESGSFGDTVLQDFGIKDRPEGYQSTSEKVLERLSGIGESELDRLNLEERSGEVKMEERDPLRIQYFKQVKVYESAYPLDANAAPRTSSVGSRGGYIGYLEFTYQIYESARKSNRSEAQSASADIPTGRRGRETYRYRFSTAGTWNGADGELVR